MLPDFLITLINDPSSEDFKIKFVFKNGDHYYKFYKGDKVINSEHLDKLKERVDILNTISDNIIEDYKLLDNNLVYFKCKKVESVVEAYSEEHRAMFESEDAYKLNWIKNATELLEKMYPLFYGDWSADNVYVQSDRSWILIDTEEVFSHKKPKRFHEMLNRLEYSFKKFCGNDKDFFDKHIDSYLEGLRSLYKNN